MTAPTLTEFILARIADDEAAGREATEDGRGTPEPEPWLAVGWPASEHPGPVVLVDPARFLAECEAKRRIVELRYSAQLMADRAGDDPTHPFVITFRSQVIAFDAALRSLAIVYADHPDYLQEWKP